MGSAFQEDLAGGGAKARKALDTVLDGLQGIKDPLAQNRAAVALFGTQAEDMGKALFSMDLDTAAKGIGKVGGAAAKTGETLADNASTNITAFARELRAVAVEAIGSKVLPMVTDLTGALKTGLGPALSKVGDVTSEVTGFLSEHKGVAVALASVIGALTVVTAAHSAVMAVGAAGGMTAWLAGTTLISTATKVWTAVQWAMNAALTANPIGIAVVAIAALVGVVVLIATKTDWFQKLWAKSWDAITDAASATFQWIKSNWPTILAVLTGPIGLAVLAIAKNWDKIEAGASAVKEWITEKFTSLAGFFAELPAKFAGSLSALTETIREVFRQAMEAGKEKVTGIGGTILGWIADIPGKLLEKLDGFRSAGAELIGGFVDGMKNAAGVIEGIAGNVWDAVKGLLNGAITKINAALEFTINLPGKDLSFNPADIPQLATGGRATASTLAIIGEGREPESVLPDSVLRGLLDRAHVAGAGDVTKMLAELRGQMRRTQPSSAAQSQRSDVRTSPLIGQVIQHPGESTEMLAERLWFKTRTRG